MSEPNDRPLEDYLKGGSKLSQKYREASGETPPPELDEKILAQARAAVSPRRRAANKPWFAGLALAASLLLAVNLGWNVYRAKPELGESARKNEVLADKGFVPNPPPAAAAPEAKPQAVAPRAPAFDVKDERKTREADVLARQEMSLHDKDAAEDDLRKKEVQHQASVARMQEMEARRDEPQRAPAEESGALASASTPAPMAAGGAAPAPAAEMAQAKAKADAPSESQKIDRLIAYVGRQQALLISNGEEYSPGHAMGILRKRREQLGDQVKTAEDFIRLCASRSPATGEDYVIRDADGQTRRAEDVLREELARINSK